MLTAFVISTLIVLFIVTLFAGSGFADKFFQKKSGSKRWHAQNIYYASFLFIIGILGLFYLWFFEESISWQCFSIGVILLIGLSILYGVAGFISLLSALWWTDAVRRKVSKWPEGGWKRRAERYLEGEEAYSGVALFKSLASESESQELTLDASIVLIRPAQGKTGKVYETELTSKGYNLQVCTDPTRVFELITNFHPDLVIWYFKRESKSEISKILKNLQVQNSQIDRPLVFLLVPTTPDIKEFNDLVDRVEQYLISPSDFIEAIEDLLKKKRQIKKAVS